MINGDGKLVSWQTIMTEAEKLTSGDHGSEGSKQEPISVREEILRYSVDGHLEHLRPQFAAYILQGVAMARLQGGAYPVRAETALQKVDRVRVHWDMLVHRLANRSRWKLGAIITGGETGKDIVASFNACYSDEACRFWHWVAMTDNLREQAYVLLCSDDEEQRREGAKLLAVTRMVVAEMKRQLTAWERAIVASSVGNREAIAQIIGPLGALFQQHQELTALTGVRLAVEEIAFHEHAEEEIDQVLKRDARKNR